MHSFSTPVNGTSMPNESRHASLTASVSEKVQNSLVASVTAVLDIKPPISLPWNFASEFSEYCFTTSFYKQGADTPTMLDQASFLAGSEIEVPVYEDTTKGASYRTSNLDGQFQRPIVTTRGQKSNSYKATVTLKTCIHGHLDKSVPNPVPATLIMLEYSLNALGKQKYAKAFTSLDFQSYPEPGVPDIGPAPAVIAWGPRTAKAHVTTAKESKTKDRKFEGLNLNVLGNGGGVDMSLGNSTTTEGTKTYFQLLQSDKSLSGVAGAGYDGVWWSLAQNENEEDGVPPKLVTAVLVQRASETAKFQCTFVLNVEAKWWHKVRASWERYWGIVVDDPVWFDPSLPAIGGDGLPPCLGEYLGRLKVDDLGSFENPPVLA